MPIIILKITLKPNLKKIKGMVPGGGVALLRTIKALEKVNLKNDGEKRGVEIIKNAIKMPALTIANNAGKDGNLIVQKLLTENASFEFGYDALNDVFVDDLFKSGIVDPTKVKINFHLKLLTEEPAFSTGEDLFTNACNL